VRRSSAKTISATRNMLRLKVTTRARWAISSNDFSAYYKCKQANKQTTNTMILIVLADCEIN